MSDVRDPATDQVAPTPNSGPSMHDLVIADMDKRKAFGLSKYGTLLQTNNGRSFLQDAYEEVLDLAVYLRGMLAEEAEEKHILTVTTDSWFLQHTMSCRRAGMARCQIHTMLTPNTLRFMGFGDAFANLKFPQLLKLWVNDEGGLQWEGTE